MVLVGAMRLTVVLLLLLALVGCARGPGHLPPTGAVEVVRLRVFTDGFHSGLVLPRVALPRTLDPVVEGWPQSFAGRSFHYGEEDWTSGENMSDLHAVRLAFIPGVGVIQTDATPLDPPEIPGTDRSRMRVWTFALSEAAYEALLARLQQEWLVAGSAPRLPFPGDPSHLITCPHDWSVWHNCHDFTADLLRTAGLDLPSHTIATAGVLAGDLDLAQAALDRAGVRVLTPR
jgi:hypothetical protein